MDKTLSKKSGFGLTAVITVIAALSLLAGGGYFVYQRLVKPANIGGIACTQEAKLCPDGSYVGRTGPDCEFALCPGEVDTSNHAPSGVEGWKTYRNDKYGFEVRYPVDKEIRDFTAQNVRYYPRLVLMIGFCDRGIHVDCVGGKVNVFEGEHEWAGAKKILYRNNLTFALNGDDSVISAFKFIK